MPRICSSEISGGKIVALTFLSEYVALLSQSEAEGEAAIAKPEENRTVIRVAHRFSTLASLDYIIVLTAGRFVEERGFAQLRERGGPFATMPNRQGIFC